MMSFEMATYMLVKKLAEKHQINATKELEEMMKDSNGLLEYDRTKFVD